MPIINYAIYSDRFCFYFGEFYKLCWSAKRKGINHRKDIKKFLHLNLKSQEPIFFLKNKYIGKSLNLDQVNCQFISAKDASNSNKAYLDFSPLTISGNTADFALYYSYENLSIEGTLTKDKNKWIVEDFKVFQF